MPILNKNEKYARNITSRIANLTGLSDKAVRAVIDGIELCLLDDLRTRAMISGNEDKDEILLEVPNIGTVKLFTSRYPAEMSNYLNGNSFNSKFIIDKKFLMKARWAYYDKHDYLTERCCDNFKDLFKEHYKSIIQSEEDDQ